MPIYEYRCRSCGHELEKLQRLSDPVLTKCPECGKAKLHRLISAAGFRLKGAGWYETDFKRDNKRNLAESAGGKGDGVAKPDSAGDIPAAAAKPEPKAEPKPEPVSGKNKTGSSATNSA